MPRVSANGIEIEYEEFGDAAADPLLLVMGLGGQLIHWRQQFCEMLAAKGHRVIRFDNRDVGLSTHFGHLGVPDMNELVVKLLQGESVEPPYSLDDMAADAFGLLDALGVESAHICGASMGGMVVQAMAIAAPHRVVSLTSIMSSTGDPSLPPAADEAIAAMTLPAASDREAAIERSVAVNAVIGSPGFPVAEDELRRRAAETYDRSFNPDGVARQTAAIVAHGSRRERLRTLSLPALVIHGAADLLVHPDAGRDTHDCLSGSRLLVLDGMGHDLPEPLWTDVVGAIKDLTSGAGAANQAAVSGG